MDGGVRVPGNSGKEYPPDPEIMKFVADKLRKGEKVALATIVEKRGSAPRNEGSKIAVAEDGEVLGTIGGGEAERLVIKEALEALKQNAPRTVRVSLYRDSLLENVKTTSQLCGGVLTVFIDILKPAQRSIIVGAGHMARALSIVLSFLGHEVIVIDNFPKHATKEKIPHASQIIVDENVPKIIVERLKPGKNDNVIIVHGDGDLEAEVIRVLLTSGEKVKYIGLLSGKGKLAYIIRKLIQSGIKPEVIVENLHSPIGLDIGSETPEEIAIAVAGEIICRERLRECLTEDKVRELTESVLEKLRQGGN